MRSTFHSPERRAQRSRPTFRQIALPLPVRGPNLYGHEDEAHLRSTAGCGSVGGGCHAGLLAACPMGWLDKSAGNCWDCLFRGLERWLLADLHSRFDYHSVGDEARVCIPGFHASAPAGAHCFFNADWSTRWIRCDHAGPSDGVHEFRSGLELGQRICGIRSSYPCFDIFDPPLCPLAWRTSSNSAAHKRMTAPG